MTAPRVFLESLELAGIKLGLEQIRALLRGLDSPERAFPAIVVAGTNGKGSVTAAIEHGLRAAGYRTGRYTSPHLVSLEERFAIDGVDVRSEVLDESLARVEAAARRLPAPPTFFEATTAAALDIFRHARVDVGILEVGMGGRLDATNAVDAVAVAITAIDYDHQQHLGHTIEEIAGEKAGVIKAGAVVVLGANPPAVEDVVARKCQKMGAELVSAVSGIQTIVRMVDGRAHLDLHTPHGDYGTLVLALRGRHQVRNAVTAIRLLEALDVRGLFAIGERAMRVAVEEVVWPARLELISRAGSDILIDGAHNGQGARALAAYVQETYGRLLPFVVGVLRDKDVDAVVSALARAASHIVCTAPKSPRALSPDDLAKVVRACAPSMPVESARSATEAVERAARSGSPVVVAGSLYLAGEIRAEVS